MWKYLTHYWNCIMYYWPYIVCSLMPNKEYNWIHNLMSTLNHIVCFWDYLLRVFCNADNKIQDIGATKRSDGMDVIGMQQYTVQKLVTDCIISLSVAYQLQIQLYYIHICWIFNRWNGHRKFWFLSDVISCIYVPCFNLTCEYKFSSRQILRNNLLFLFYSFRVENMIRSMSGKSIPGTSFTMLLSLYASAFLYVSLISKR